MIAPLLLTSTWLLLLAAVLLAPFLAGAADPGDALIRNTIRLSLTYYAVAVTLMLWPRPLDRAARCGWTIAWFTYVIHVALAFHYAHGWSHARAVQHTEEVSGVGEGIFVSHLFTLLWTADVAWWWLAPQRRATRSVWIDRALHGFMLFVIFNATVIFETGLVRWAGVLLFVWLAALALWRRRENRGSKIEDRGSRIESV